MRVELHGEDDTVRFVVQDEGMGFEPSAAETIFERFRRLDPQQTRGIGGTGLGLYIARELVRRMGGRIWAESERGRGAVFSFEPPGCARRFRRPSGTSGSRDTRSPSSSPSRARAGPRERELVVEDHRQVGEQPSRRVVDGSDDVAVDLGALGDHAVDGRLHPHSCDHCRGS